MFKPFPGLCSPLRISTCLHKHYLKLICTRYQYLIYWYNLCFRLAFRRLSLVESDDDECLGLHTLFDHLVFKHLTKDSSFTISTRDFQGVLLTQEGFREPGQLKLQTLLFPLASLGLCHYGYARDIVFVPGYCSDGVWVLLIMGKISPPCWSMVDASGGFSFC